MNNHFRSYKHSLKSTNIASQVVDFKQSMRKLKKENKGKRDLIAFEISPIKLVSKALPKNEKLE